MYPCRRRFRNDRHHSDCRGSARSRPETHHVVWRITDGDDPDWASWYFGWLLDLSELPALLGAKPIRSRLSSTPSFNSTATTPRRDRASVWEDVYARGLSEHFVG